jgi:hypothetical protein
MTLPRKKLTGRKLLGATLGLASVSLVGCTFSSGNLVVPDAPIEEDDAGTDAPEPQDGGTTEDAGVTEDAGTTEDTGTTEDAGDDRGSKP